MPPPSAYCPPILVYHHVSPDHAHGENGMKDSVRLGDFRRQMALLAARFRVLPLSRLVAAMRAREAIPARTVAITFDDGYRSTFTRALPVLAGHGIPACVFLATGLMGTGAPFPWLPACRDEEALPMSWPEAAAFCRAGMEAGSHTATHRFLPELPEDEIEAELTLSKEAMEERLGASPFALALPFSFPLTHRRWPLFRARLLAALGRSAYRCCCTLQRGPVGDGSGVLFLPRVAVTGSDGLCTFYAKALGLYRYTHLSQRLFQTLFKRYKG